MHKRKKNNYSKARRKLKQYHNNKGEARTSQSDTSKKNADSSNTVSSPSDSKSTKPSAVHSQMKYLAKHWLTFLAVLFGTVMTTTVLTLLGFNPLPQSIPLLSIVSRYPVVSLLVIGVLGGISVTALIILVRPESTNSHKGSHIPQWIFSSVMSVTSLLLFIILLITILLRAAWCPTTLCPPPKIITIPKVLMTLISRYISQRFRVHIL